MWLSDLADNCYVKKKVTILTMGSSGRSIEIENFEKGR
jgi:hypothetical protein